MFHGISRTFVSWPFWGYEGGVPTRNSTSKPPRATGGVSHFSVRLPCSYVRANQTTRISLLVELSPRGTHVWNGRKAKLHMIYSLILYFAYRTRENTYLLDNITNKSYFSEIELHMIHLFYCPVIVKVRYGTIYFRCGTRRHGTVPYGTCTGPHFDRRHKLALAGIELATRLNLYM